MCAWGKGKDSCVGDSGGPLVVEEHGNYVLIGIVRCQIYTNTWLIYSPIIGNQQLLVVINQKLLRILRHTTPYQLRQNWWNRWNGAHYLWTWRKWRGLHQGAALRFMDSLCYGSSHNLRRLFWFITSNIKYNLKDPPIFKTFANICYIQAKTACALRALTWSLAMCREEALNIGTTKHWSRSRWKDDLTTEHRK